MKKFDSNYDLITEWFDSHRRKDLDLERSYLNFVKNYLSPGDKILDVGCGTGEPIARYFIENGYKLTGIDSSKKMITLCKARFPSERWIFADMKTLNLQEKFDMVIAWHSIFHLSHEDQRKTLKLLMKYLKPKGLLIFTSGSEYSEEWVNNGGMDLYQASLSLEEYQNTLKENNFALLLHTVKDPNCGEATVWVCQK